MVGGSCVAGGGHVWREGMCGRGMHGRGVYVAGGMHGRGHVWQGGHVWQIL